MTRPSHQGLINRVVSGCSEVGGAERPCRSGDVPEPVADRRGIDDNWKGCSDRHVQETERR